MSHITIQEATMLQHNYIIHDFYIEEIWLE